jgi:hypothetical protein
MKMAEPDQLNLSTALDPHLEPLRPLLGRTWRGVFEGSPPDKPVVDVMRWERALNGKAVRVLHSINAGEYGGETLFRWDEQAQAVRYHYFTTAGFMTAGVVTFEGGKLVTHEVVSGSAGEATEVRGTSEILPGDEFRVQTEYLVDGEWQPGRVTTYSVDREAKVIFR